MTQEVISEIHKTVVKWPTKGQVKTFSQRLGKAAQRIFDIAITAVPLIVGYGSGIAFYIGDIIIKAIIYGFRKGSGRK